MERLRRWYFEPQTHRTSRARRWYATLLYSLPLAGVVHASLIPLVALLGSRALVVFNAGSVVLYALASIACRSGWKRLAYWMMGAEVAAHAILSVQQLGWAAGYQNALFLLAVGNGPNRFDRLSMILIGVAAMTYGYRMGPPELALSPSTLTALFVCNTVIAFGLVAAGLGVLEGATGGLERELAAERAQSEGLLKRELSHQVAERSRELGAALARSDVTLDVRQLSAGERFDERYRIVGALGAGGMGAVYEVERLTDGAALALKVVVGRVSGASAARFAREAEIGARIHHTNLVPIVDVGVSAGVPFLVMELVRGGSLEGQRARFGDVAWALPILRQVAEGLAVLHDAGVVHRDLKPANVLLAGEGPATVAKISDFGISRFGALEDSAAPNAPTVDPNAPTVSPSAPSPSALTGTGVVMGTPLYMAPEAARGGRNVDAPADVFALGIIAYEMLSGRAPFSVPPVMLAMAEQPVPAPPPVDEPRVPAALGALVLSCLSSDPALRPRVRRVLAELA